jgi:dihydrofolate synthase/folylpolyglutamate synthase
VVLDGAQNRASAEALVRALPRPPRPARAVLVLAMAADKDIDGTLAVLLPHFHSAVFTTTGTPRAEPPDRLAARARDRGFVRCDVAATPADALRRATAGAGQAGLVCVTGSLYLVGAVLAERGKEPLAGERGRR